MIRAATAMLVASAALALGASTASALSSQQQRFLVLAEQGAARARSAWADNRQTVFIHRRNRRIGWYDERLNDRDRYPLATIWGALPLFESLSAIAVADPTPDHAAALVKFAEGPAGSRTAHVASAHGASARFAQGAEAYWDPAVRPAPGYAPYPGDRMNANTWCDDNAWWGLAFFDAYLALHSMRMLADAQRAFAFIVLACWDVAAGGMWWNTFHIPAGQKAGEPLAGGSLLGALLAQAYLALAQSSSAHAASASAKQQAMSDLQNVEKWLAWGDANFAGPGGLYWRTGDDSTPTPYIAGTTVAAKQVLCQAVGEPYCGQAAGLADAAAQRFEDRLNMGPQFDTIYLHWMLRYGKQTNDSRWAALALEMADQALANSRDSASGLYLRAWDGGDMSGHQADPNMLRSDAATVELFGWLAADGP